MKDIEENKKKCNDLVHHWPITVEIYPTGHVAFIARPFQFGRRWHRTFATASFGSPEQCAAAAINYCKRVLAGTDPEVQEAHLVHEQKKASRHGLTKELVAQVLSCLRRKIDVLSLLREAEEKAIYHELRKKHGGRE